jgi:hypothetical protein
LRFSCFSPVSRPEKLPFYKDGKGLFSMIKREPPAGICQTCNNALTCGYRINDRRTITFCEEFDNVSESIEHRQAGGARAPERNIDIAMGLCCNCNNIDSCRLPKPPGGVWHCEEYA